MRLTGAVVLALACMLASGAGAGERPGNRKAEASPAAPDRADEGSATREALAAAIDPDRPGSTGRDLEAETEVTLDRGRGVSVGGGLSGPLGFAGSLRLMRGLSADVRDEDGTRVQALCALPLPHCAQGFLLQLDAGTGGGKVSLGLGARAHVDEEDFRGTAGFALRAAVVRTWGSPIGTEPGVTYLGPELDLSVLRVDLTLGVLWRLGSDRGASALFSWGVGFGL